MPQKLHDPETKAAVCAELSAGQSMRGVAARYGIPLTTVHTWSLKLQAAGGAFLRSEPNGTQKEQPSLDEFGRLLTTYVKESLETLVVQVRHSRDPEWLARQDAGDLAVLHGVLTDKILRVLEAAERAAEFQSVRMVERGWPEGDDPSLP